MNITHNNVTYYNTVRYDERHSIYIIKFFYSDDAGTNEFGELKFNASGLDLATIEQLIKVSLTQALEVLRS